MLAAYFTPKPELSSEQLRERLAGVVSQVYRGGESERPGRVCCCAALCWLPVLRSSPLTSAPFISFFPPADRTAQQAAEGDQQEQPDQQRGGGGAPQPYRLPARGASDSIHTVLTAEPTPVYGALMLPCVAKGRHYYGRPNVESDMLQVGDASCSSCSCANVLQLPLACCLASTQPRATASCRRSVPVLTAAIHAAVHTARASSLALSQPRRRTSLAPPSAASSATARLALLRRTSWAPWTASAAA